MTPKELKKLVAEIRSTQSESDTVEVKTARGGTPKRLYEALSAFANRTDGGIILFGIDESKDFSIVGVGNAHQLQEEITSLASDNMEPVLRPEFTVDEIDGETVVAVEIDEVPASQKPCFYKTAGLPKGAYLRVGNTNRQMTEYEVFGYLSGRGQPTHDEDTVPDVSLEDLDNSLIETYLERLCQIHPRASFLKSAKEEIFLRLKIAAQDSGVICPTLAGLLMFGKYPQEYFPQLMITFVQYFGTTEDERTPQGARFVDNRRFEGPITEMVQEAETYIMSAMRKSSLIDGMFRRDITEYPRESLRESIANAVAHRDYSKYVRGSYIQVRMFADRLEVRSPGGLFGNVTVDNLEDEHSTRNARLMRMMEDMQVVENRGSGISAMLHTMREANLEPPRFDDRRASFKVTFHNHTLMTAEVITWLNQFSHLPLNDQQRLALVYLRQHSHTDNRDYRRLNRVDMMIAGQDLRGLVQTGLVEQTGFGRWTKYVLKVKDFSIDNSVHKSDEEKILSYIIKHGSINNSECRELLNVNDARAYYLLKKLSQKGKLKALKKGKGRRYVVP
ncbi:MAG: putative DNA binding domain-containing protein [Deltaproteobacteria bacterium]|nr:putative DNA binding domain-containing protein [Deltaproteobacteria bacterium]